jgi:hypothetical protein
MSVNDLSTKFCFRTKREYYWKEERDIKNNTIRKIDLADERFRELIAWMEIGWNDGDINIIITDAESASKSFEREIRDITLWDEFMIITWNPKNKEVKDE